MYKMSTGFSSQQFISRRFVWVYFLLIWSQRTVDAAHSRRRIIISRNSYSDQRYDRSITSFDPNGRLLQVEYSIEATKRGETILAFLTGDNNILVFVAKPKDRATVSAKVHRIDEHIWLYTTGLSGDARALAAHLRANARQHRLSYGEPMTVEEVAKQSAAVQHELTRTGGARPLGCTAIVVGMDPTHADVKPGRLFRTDPGGGLEDCYFCCAGRDQESLMAKLIEKYEKIKMRSTSEVIRKLVGYMLHGQDKGKTCLDVWLLRSNKQNLQELDMTCFTDIGSSESLKTIASYLEHEFNALS